MSFLVLVWVNQETDLAISFSKNNLPALVGNIALSKTLNSINKFKKIIREKGTIKTGKWLTLSILNEDIDDIIKIVKSSGYSEV